RGGGRLAAGLRRARPGAPQRRLRAQHRVLRLLAGADDRRPDSPGEHRPRHRAPARGQRPAGGHRPGDEVAAAHRADRRDPCGGAGGGAPATRPPVAPRVAREVRLEPGARGDEGDADLRAPSEFGGRAAPGADIDRAVELLLSAQRPLIYAGGGVGLSGASEALAAVADHLQAGVVTSAEGKGAVSDHRDLSLGAAFWRESPLYAHVHAADVVLAVGSRLVGVTFAAGTRIVHIDADPQEIGRNHRNTTGLVGDARMTLAALLEPLRAAGPPRASLKAEREALRAQIAAMPRQEPQASILAALRKGTPEDAIFVAGMTQIGYYSRPFWPVYHPRTYLTSSYSGNLGYAFPV